jgi:urease accessory protein UreE
MLTGGSYVLDRVVLDADERHRRRITLTGERGTVFLLDLPHAIALRDGDGLVLDDGTIVRVAGKPERLVEIAVATPRELARLAWHLGNRHTDVQIVGDRLYSPRLRARGHAARARRNTHRDRGAFRSGRRCAWACSWARRAWAS